MSRSGFCLIRIPVGMWEGYKRGAKLERMTENATECTVPNFGGRALNVEPLSSDPEYHPKFNPFIHTGMVAVADLIRRGILAHLLDQRESWGSIFLLERK